MPIYEFKCQECGKITEVFFRSIHQKTDISCPHCRSKNLKKIISAPSAVSQSSSSLKGLTCCGRTERCEIPPCSTGNRCRRD